MPYRKSKKHKKYYDIIKKSLEGHSQGFCHREHRTRRRPKEKVSDLYKIKKQKIIEKEILEQLKYDNPTRNIKQLIN